MYKLYEVSFCKATIGYYLKELEAPKISQPNSKKEVLDEGVGSMVRAFKDVDNQYLVKEKCNSSIFKMAFSFIVFAADCCEEI